MNLDRDKLVHQLAMIASLKKAIEESGGAVPTDEFLLDMTLLDMLDLLAQNNIRFVWKG